MLFLPKQFTIPLLKAYLEQFILPSSSCPAIKKNSKVELKGNKKERKKAAASKLDMAGNLELSHQEFKTTVSNMLRALMDKGGVIQEQMGTVDSNKMMAIKS